MWYCRTELLTCVTLQMRSLPSWTKVSLMLKEASFFPYYRRDSTQELKPRTTTGNPCGFLRAISYLLHGNIIKRTLFTAEMATSPLLSCGIMGGCWLWVSWLTRWDIVYTRKRCGRRSVFLRGAENLGTRSATCYINIFISRAVTHNTPGVHK